MKALVLTDRQLCDLELILNGGFAPLEGFLSEQDYLSVCQNMRLHQGTLWPVPISLDVSPEFSDDLENGEEIQLTNSQNVAVAAMKVESIYKPNLPLEAELVFGTKSSAHLGVKYLLERTKPVYLGGKVKLLEVPEHFDFAEFRFSPSELKKEFAKLGWKKIIAFQTRNPIHMAHYELIISAAKEVEANILLHPVVGPTMPGDVDYATRVKCYQAILPKFPKDKVKLSLLNLAMRMAGPREALWHAIIRKNFGCTHFIVGRDHASPANDLDGKSFYKSYQAQELVSEYQKEIGITPVLSKEIVNIKGTKNYKPLDQLSPNETAQTISGKEFRIKLDKGEAIPEWFSFPEVIKQLQASYKPTIQRGFTILFTGFPSAGKSTVAQYLHAKLLEITNRPISFLDGDQIRRKISPELGYTKEDRDLNIRRIGFLASKITQSGGIAICAAIAPYKTLRDEIREMIEEYGKIFIVYVKASIEECEKRDRKGIYAKARAGLIKGVTGIDDPYEVPIDPDIEIDTTILSPLQSRDKVIECIRIAGYI